MEVYLCSVGHQILHGETAEETSSCQLQEQHLQITDHYTAFLSNHSYILPHHHHLFKSKSPKQRLNVAMTNHNAGCRWNIQDGSFLVTLLLHPALTSLTTLFYLFIWRPKIEDTILVLDGWDEVVNFLTHVLICSSLSPTNSEQQDSNISISGSCLITMYMIRYHRLIKEANTPSTALDKFEYPPMTSLTDGFPILFAASKSFEKFNERMRNVKSSNTRTKRRK